MTRPAAPVCTLADPVSVAEAPSFAALKGVFMREGRATTEGLDVSVACALDSGPVEVPDASEVVVAVAASDAEAEAEAGAESGAESVEGAAVVISLSTPLVND